MGFGSERLSLGNQITYIYNQIPVTSHGLFDHTYYSIC